jgi:predicted CopG family antitoxin
MVKKILVDFDEETFEKLVKAKGDKTWREVIINTIPKNKNEMLQNLIYEKFGDVKASAGSIGRKDIFDLIEVLRIVALRCVNNGVDKDKIFGYIKDLLVVE